MNQIDLTLYALHWWTRITFGGHFVFAMSTLYYFCFSFSYSSDESKTVVGNTKRRSIRLTYCGPSLLLWESPDGGPYVTIGLPPPLPPLYESHPVPPILLSLQCAHNFWESLKRLYIYIKSIANENIFPHLTGLVFSFHVIQWEYLFSLYKETGRDIFTCTVNDRLISKRYISLFWQDYMFGLLLDSYFLHRWISL